MMSDEANSEREVNLAALIHHTVSTSEEYVANFDKMLESSSENFLLPREVIQALRAIIWASGSLTANLYEENMKIRELLESFVPKNQIMREELMRRFVPKNQT
jgi:hypothetical protein